MMDVKVVSNKASSAYSLYMMGIADRYQDATYMTTVIEKQQTASLVESTVGHEIQAICLI
ncbi:MAG: hypothetical protein ACTIKR_16790 [Advenella sp.]|uniref:hypothetical protein n=1 Tax=Advenella sp. TaxID=1872388 RepID=UPI003F984AF3